MTTSPSPDFIDPVRRDAVRGLLHDTVQEQVHAAPAVRRRRAMRVVAVAAVVLVLGGVGLAYADHASRAPGQGTAVARPVTSAPARPSSPPSSSASTADPSATSQPAGTSTPLPDPALADPSSWSITTAGIGPIAIGASQTTAAATGSTAYTVMNPGYACPVDVYTPKNAGDPELTTRASSGDRIDFVIIGGLGAKIPARSPKTPSGIGLGSTRAALLATYPTIETLSTSVGTPSTFGMEYGIEDSSGRWLTFELDEQGRIGQINVSFTKGVPGELC